MLIVPLNFIRPHILDGSRHSTPWENDPGKVDLKPDRGQGEGAFKREEHNN